MTRGYRSRSGPNWIGISFVLGALLVVLLGVSTLAGLLAGPGGGEGGTPTPAGPTASPTDAAPTGSTEPVPTEPAPTEEPGASPTPAPTDEPTASPSPPPAGAAACTGNDENRAFFEDAAAALRFETYCGALPSGWSIVRGSYRGAGGGRLEVEYRGPGGATLRLREGPAACADDPDCPPTGDALGEARFGDRPAELRRTDGGLAIVAADGATVYLAETTGIDEATSRELGAGLARVTAP